MVKRRTILGTIAVLASLYGAVAGRDIPIVNVCNLTARPEAQSGQMLRLEGAGWCTLALCRYSRTSPPESGKTGNSLW